MMSDFTAKSKTNLYNPYEPIAVSGILHRYGRHLQETVNLRKAAETEAASSSSSLGDDHQLGQKRHRDREDENNTSRSTITLSSETKLDDILRERTRQAAAMGVTRALDLTKEEADMKHKEKLHLSGGDTATRIADQVMKLKSSTVGVDRESGEATLPCTAAMSPLPPAFSDDKSPSKSPSTSSSISSTTPSLPPTKLLESHLEFQRGKDGKHVIAAAPSRGVTAPKVKLHGKPSATLIIRNLVLRDTFYGRDPPSTNHGTSSIVDIPTQTQIATAFKERIIAEVSAECGRCGHVKNVVVCDMFQTSSLSSSDATTAASSSFSYPSISTLAPSSHHQEGSQVSPVGASLIIPSSFKSQRDAIVVWVRMDTVMSGFKAAERINGKVFLGDASRLAVVGFYPTPIFDQGIRSTNNDVLVSFNGGGSGVASPTSSSSSIPSLPSAVIESLENLLPAEYLNR